MKKTKLESLYATCDGRNIGAVRMLEKAEFELIDKIPDYRLDIDGTPGDEYLYELELRQSNLSFFMYKIILYKYNNSRC